MNADEKLLYLRRNQQEVSPVNKADVSGSNKTKFLNAAIVLGLLALTPAGLGAGAVVEGTVKLPPPVLRPPLNARYQGDPAKAPAPPPAPVAVVYLEGSFPLSSATNAPAVMSQKGLQFSPGLLAIQKGVTVEFPNFDEVYHNVFSYSKPKRFDLGRYLKDEKPAAQRFDQPGVIQLYCEIHEHMRGTILVLDTPHFARTDTNGVYRLENLPVGKYTLKAWLNEKTVWERPVELAPDKTTRVEFTGP